MALLKESLKPLGFLQPNILAIILGERGFDDSEQKNCAIRTRKAGSTWSPPSSGRRFVVLLTKVDDPSWLDENRVDIEKDFPECKQFLYVDFPGVDTEDPDMEATNGEVRQEELEKQMKEMFKADPWVEPDIFKMGDEEIKEKANSILERIATFVKKVMKDVKPSVVQTITVFVSFAQLIVMLAAAA
jgi:hypothetical protein